MRHRVWAKGTDCLLSQVFTDGDCVGRWEKATVHNHHSEIYFIQSMPVVHLCVCRGSNYGSHVSATELDEFVYKRGHYAGTHTCHMQLLTQHVVLSTSSLISSQQLFCYATSQEKSETNSTKLAERWNRSVRLCWNPAVDSLTGVVPVVQLIWVVMCPLWTQSTDVPYITTRTVYCFSKWRRIMTYSWGESVEEEVFWFKISRLEF